MNVFTCICRLGKDPEQRSTANGDSVVQFDAAVDSGFGDKKVTTWIRFAMFGKRGASVLPYLAKGNQVAVSGEIANRKWTDKEGQDRYSLECRVNDLTLISKNEREQPHPVARSEKQQPVKSGDLDDDIPF